MAISWALILVVASVLGVHVPGLLWLLLIPFAIQDHWDNLK